MKRHRSAAGLALAVVAILGLASPAEGDEQVPFCGHWCEISHSAARRHV